MNVIEEYADDDDEVMNNSEEEDNKIITNSAPDKKLLLLTGFVVLDWVVNSRVYSGFEFPFDVAIQNITDVEPLTEELLEENKISENSVCYGILMNGPKFYRVTNMSPMEYVELCNIIKYDYCTKPISMRKNEDDLEELINSRPTRRLFNVYDAVLLYLMVLDGVGFDYIGIIFKCSVATVFEYAEFIAELINSDLENDLKWPSASERKNRYGTIACYEKAIAIIDGTHCQIRRPVDIEQENAHYSGYKCHHTQNYLVVVDAFGFILYLDGPFPGRTVDITACRDTDMFQNINNYLSPGERLLGDGGFEGWARIITQFDKTKLHARGVTTEERNRMKTFNSHFTNMRSRVEHKIHRTKARATSLAQRFNRYKHRQYNTIKSACILNNWTQRKRISRQIDL